MMVASPQRKENSMRNAYPPEVFDLMTDILADLVLEDLKQCPQIPSNSRIDRCDGRENTLLPTQAGGG